jgi:hypothetical protein
MAIHESGQMYLETIYILSQDSTFVRAIDVGEQLGFTKPSVSRAMSILKKDGYVNVDADGAITLTETGLAIAKTMYTPPYGVEPDADGTGCGREDRDRGRLPDRACDQRKILCGGAGALGAGNENAGRCSRAMSLSLNFISHPKNSLDVGGVLWIRLQFAP